jgi:hypothetical protein
MTPPALQRASLQEYGGPDTGAVVNGVPHNIEDCANHTIKIPQQQRKCNAYTEKCGAQQENG